MNKPSNQSGTWKSRPVFISSTFKDMHAERDWLRNRIFPRLEEELRRRHHHLELIDLRLGVETAKADTEEARELLVLKVCLDEIKRSRPFLLVVLGDRYGWVPPEDRIAAAAREQGFKTSPTGKSVTALEVEFGLLKEDSTQKHRSLFFFRQPLPYDQMTKEQREIYSDAHSPDPKVRAGHSKLVELKNRLSKDPEFGPRVFEYSLGWDVATGKVTGLEVFEKLVFDKLWAVIDEETRADAAQVPPKWEEQERAALSEFVEHRSRIFVGRDDVIKQLLKIARSPAVTGQIGSTIWGACVTGSPGSGKSAVFAKLYRELDTNDRGILLLANAAGGTQRGASVDAMLRRWIAELSATAGTADPLPEKASSDDVETAFYSLLRQVSAKRRVVILLDALDQFEPTPRGRHFTWFKQHQWPTNARIIATGLPCPAGEVLSQWAGIEEVELLQLTAADAAGIGKQVWGHYHREINPAVLRVLVEKKMPDGTPSCGSPLWLTLALEQLNLLDADDFARAEREFTGSPVERMTALLIDTAKRMPPDIGGLYGWLLEQNEKAFGAANTRGFSVAIALSRSGWRETDLLALVPRLAKILNPSSFIDHNSSLDALGLAALRRGFRAHIVRRGENGQLDFFHAQMRRAIIEHYATKEADLRKLHEQIADHFESLPEEDPLRINETMFHLLGFGDRDRTATYIDKCMGVDRWIVPAATVAAISTLSDIILAAPDDNACNHWIEWIAGMLNSQNSEQCINVARGIVNDLDDALARNGTARAEQVREKLLQVATQALQDILTAKLPHSESAKYQGLSALQNKSSAVSDQKLDQLIQRFDAQLAETEDTKQNFVQYLLATGYSKLGDITRLRGDLDGAIQTVQKAADLKRAVKTKSPVPSDISDQLRIGDMLFTEGDIEGSARIYKKIHDSIKTFASDCFPDLQMLHSRCLSRLADVMKAKGDLYGALNVYRESLGIQENMVSSASNRKVSRTWTGDDARLFESIMASGGRGITAEEHVRLFGKLGEIATPSDPSAEDWQRAISISQAKIGETLHTQMNFDGALEACRASLEGATRLAEIDPDNTDAQHQLALAHGRMGDVLESYGDIAGAIKAYRECSVILKKLVAANPSNVTWLYNLAANLDRIGDALNVQGDVANAFEAFRESLFLFMRLVEFEPTNPRRLHGITVLFRKVGDALMEQERLTDAEKAYRESLDAAQRVVSIDSSNAAWQQSLWFAYSRMGTITEATNHPDALTWWRKAYDQLSGMKQHGIMLPTDEKFLLELKKKAGL